MAGYNRVILIGNLTRDPQVKYTPAGTAVTEIGMAMSRQFTDKQTGQRRDEVTFVDVTLWGRTAEIAGEYLNKGKQVMIEGRLQLDSWEDKQTQQKRYRLRVVGESMQMLGNREGGGGGGQSGGGGGYRGGSSAAPSFDSGPPVEATFEPDMMGGPPADEVPF